MLALKQVSLQSQNCRYARTFKQAFQHVLQLSVKSKYWLSNLYFLVFAVSTRSHECAHHHQGACQGEFLVVPTWFLRVEHPNEFCFHRGRDVSVPNTTFSVQISLSSLVPIFWKLMCGRGNKAFLVHAVWYLWQVIVLSFLCLHGRLVDLLCRHWWHCLPQTSICACFWFQKNSYPFSPIFAEGVVRVTMCTTFIDVCL